MSSPSSRRHRRQAALLLALSHACAAFAGESVDDARRLLRAGDVAGAEALLARGDGAGGEPYRRALLEADLALTRGEAARAAALFEHAAHLDGEHPAAEIGLSRAWFAAGEYRRALSYAHLASGEHEDSDAALAWLAYLEDRAGYVDSALARLRSATARWPAPSSSAAALVEILLERGRVAEAAPLLAAWRPPLAADIARLALRVARADGAAADTGLVGLADGPAQSDSEGPSWPAPPQAAAPARFEAALWRGNGVLVDGGRAVLTRTPPRPGLRLVVRDSRGQLHEARSLREHHGVALLALDAPLPAAQAVAASGANLAPDGVRFCFVLGHATLAAGTAAYPALTPAVILRANLGVAELMQISTPLATDHGGSPVFDGSGRLIGLALAPQDTIAGIADRKRDLGEGSFAVRGDALASLLPPGAAPPLAAGAALSTDELYERLAPAVVEVWMLPTTAP